MFILRLTKKIKNKIMKKKIKRFLLMLIAILALQSCSDKEDYVITPYDSAVGANGGIMYDKFWVIASYDQASPNIAKLNANPDFFRCKQCHAWDGLGTAGSYNNRGPKTNRPNISVINLYQLAQSKTEQQLFDALKKTEGRRSIITDLSTYNPKTPSTQVEGDKMPNLNELLTDAQLWDMVKFLKTGMIDVSKLYDASYTGTYPTGKSVFSNVGLDGNEANGNVYYKTNCASCHGTDGKSIRNLDATFGMTVGKFTRTKPNELQHKIHYGQLGSSMGGKFNISVSEMKDLYKAMANTTTYPD